MQITNIKCRDDIENFCLTFNWPQGVEQVYISADKNMGNKFHESICAEGMSKNVENKFHESICAEGMSKNMETAKLFTLQEYKKLGGFSIRKTPGIFTYYVCAPGGQPSEITFTCKTSINCDIIEKTEFFGKVGKIGKNYKNHQITFTAEYDTPSGIICYAKSGGITYFFGEPLKALHPLTRIVRTKKNEDLELFISKNFSDLYTINVNSHSP